MEDRLLQGTLDALVLKILGGGPLHGWGIAQRLAAESAAVLQVQQGSLYPALRRLEGRGWVRARWGRSQNNRRARFYRLTATGRRQLVRELAAWQRLARAIDGLLGSS